MTVGGAMTVSRGKESTEVTGVLETGVKGWF